MRIEALEYLIAIDKYGSISKAAESLYLSQPNLSVALKQLEKELGCELIVRTAGGTHLTEKGRRALAVARNIASEKEKLALLNTQTEKVRFRVIATFSQYAANAFYKLVKAYQDNDCMELSFSNGDIDEALASVYNDKADLGILIHSANENKEVEDYAAIHRLAVTPQKKMIYHVQVRNGHPLLESGFAEEKLWDYPCVQYLTDRRLSYDNLEESRIINPAKRIFAGNHTIKSQVVANTDAYSIGVVQPSKDMKAMGITGIPLPGYAAQISSVCRKNVRHDPAMILYLEKLKAELSEL